MRQIILDPYEAKIFIGTKCSVPKSVPAQLTDEQAIALWKTVMVSVTTIEGETVPVPMTASMSLSMTIQKFMEDQNRVKRKFGRSKVSAKQIYESIGMSRSTWGRIMRGELLDIERGNVFALAIALRLNTTETQELLYSAGFALNFGLELDAAIMYFIKHEIYDYSYICSVLSKFSDVKNGLDNFRLAPMYKRT